MTINVKKLNNSAKLPFRATEHSAGADLFAFLEAPITLEPSQRLLIPTGISVEIPTGYGGFVFPRSSLSSKHGITLSNCVGVIDADYRGEVKVALVNHSNEPYIINNGERIAQMVIMPVEVPNFIETDELSDTDRGIGGFGSTGL
ncbi:MAG: dUTP diphosphatase [Oscillospiraceae bacterium]|nr:dUTP diphosphatase [Oscillospiraceae bacterium]